MSNQAAIDWFARNIHTWPSKDDVAHCWPPSGLGLPEYISLHKDQWLARRTELQGKPSWKDAPEWAEWLAQHNTGFWCWGSGEAKQATNGIWYSPALGRTSWTGSAGEVLGDWRDTLERRPDRTTAEMEAELVKASFEPFTSIEDNQEQKMQQDNGWFDRGELPPVGTACEHVGLLTGKIERAVVVAVHHFTGEAIWSHRENGGPLFYGMRGRFRPIHTDRDKALEEMMKDSGALPCETTESIMLNLYDAGYRKETK